LSLPSLFFLLCIIQSKTHPPPFFFFFRFFLFTSLHSYLQIPDELPTILKEYTKEVIRSGVSADQVIQWSADYFAQKAAEQKAAANPEA
jgi:hypothetical protein